MDTKDIEKGNMLSPCHSLEQPFNSMADSALCSSSLYRPFLDAISFYTQYGAGTGLVIGGIRQARLSSLVFMAEHQHLKMKSQQDWYTYFKMKNYRMLHGFIQGGAAMALKMGALCTAYAALERSIALARGSYASRSVDAWPCFAEDYWNAPISGSLFGASFACVGPRRWQKLKLGMAQGLLIGSLVGLLKMGEMRFLAMGKRNGLSEPSKEAGIAAS